MGVGLIFHAPNTKMGLVMLVSAVAFAVDYLWVQWQRTFKVKSSLFHRLEQSVQLTFKNPKGFDSETSGYILVMIPWLTKSQWHAFSHFAHPTLADHSCVMIGAVGTWT